jgi:lipoprotein-releasing system permease protein
MSYELFIGLRYLKAKRKQSFISVITFISIAGITLGVMALIIVLSVMGGFEDDLKKKILGINAHLVVMELSRGLSEPGLVMGVVNRVDGVKGSTPYTYNQAMLSSSGGVMGVVVRGIDTDTVGEVTILPQKMKEGKLADINPTFRQAALKDELPGIIIGNELAKHLSLEVGDETNVISPLGTTTASGSAPRMASFQVAGIFEMGMYEYDSSLIFMSVPNAQSFFKLKDRVTGVEVKIDDIYRADAIKGKILDRLEGPYWVRTWKDMNKNLFSALKLEKVAMFIILTLIIVVAAMNIISTLIMVVMEKGKDIAILKSMGATSASIMKIFMIEGVIIGLSGTALGTFAGVIGALNLEVIVGTIEKIFNFKVLAPSVYYIDKLPSRVEPEVVMTIALLSIAISFLATIYPSWQASRLDPVEGLRYE